MEFTSFIGIDISKSYFDVALLTKEGSLHDRKRFPNGLAGFKHLVKWSGGKATLKGSLFCLEHTGIYGLPICVYFDGLAVHYSLQSGLQIKRSMGIQRGKNDKADAYVIARYAYLHRNGIQCHRLPSKAILKLKQLIPYRERLVKSKTAIKTAAKELVAFAGKGLSGMVCGDSREHVDRLDKSILKLDKAMGQLISEGEKLNALFGLVTSVKGVGLQIAANLLVATHGFSRFKDWRKFSCYCGLAPFEHRSGSSVRGRTKASHLGNRKMKALIGNGVASAIQHDPELAGYSKRKLAEGKHKMVVLNAVKNKMISRVFAVVKRGTPYVALFRHT